MSKKPQEREGLSKVQQTIAAQRLSHLFEFEAARERGGKAVRALVKRLRAEGFNVSQASLYRWSKGLRTDGPAALLDGRVSPDAELKPSADLAAQLSAAFMYQCAAAFSRLADDLVKRGS